MRHFDVQLIGGIVLHQGKIAEMRTGEGKTLVAPLAAILNALAGQGVHVVTVNDYLARRDAQWMGPIYHFLGPVGRHDPRPPVDDGAASYVFEPGYPTNDERLINLRPVTRREAYAADITYGTNNEFGFDYLRDNMVTELEPRVQRERFFAIVDEVDNILIDEARTPLIISGQAEESADLYYTFARLVPRLASAAQTGSRATRRTATTSSTSRTRPSRRPRRASTRSRSSLGVENIYDADPRFARHFEQALRAHALYKRDRDYIVKDGEIVIVDEFTGRQMPGRRWSEGLHQAIEAKEGLRVQRESVTIATITFQNYFRLYDKLAGMTGTAMTEAEEFHKIYQLEVVAIPTHRPMVRDDDTDLVYLNEKAKFNAVIDEIEEHAGGGPAGPRRHRLGREVRAARRAAQAARHQARGPERQVPREGGADRRPGRPDRAPSRSPRTWPAAARTSCSAATRRVSPPSSSTSKGLNPAEVDKATYDAALAEAKAITEEDHERVVKAGGLHIIGTERHESRRIDNQLRGRAGRQGDPGSSRFYLSLDDDLMKRFASERVAGLMERLGLDEDNYIESGIVGKTIESAQTRVEGFNFDIRKRVVEFDDVINRQRETIYAERDKVLRNEDLTETIRVFLDEDLDEIVERHLGEPNDAVTEEGLTDLLVELGRMGLGGDRIDHDELLELRSAGAVAEHVKRGRRRAARGQGGRGRRRGLGDDRALRPPAHDRLAVGRAPHRARRHAPGHRPPRLRPAGPAQRVPQGGVPACTRSCPGFIRHQVASTIFRVSIQPQPAAAGRACSRCPVPGQRAAARRAGAAVAGIGRGAACRAGRPGDGRTRA